MRCAKAARLALLSFAPSLRAAFRDPVQTSACP
jgi:hypothetical protein